MVDVHETPATPPFDSKGDERIGYYVAGGALVVLGWVLSVAANLLLHAAARSGSFELGTVHFGPTMGAYAWAVFGLGLATGGIGAGLFWVARTTARGSFALPGADY